MEHNPSFVREDSTSSIVCLWMNAGCFGEGRLAVSLLSIEITVVIVGLSLASSCTHKRPICMHLIISAWLLGCDISGSIRDVTFSAFHNFHAYVQTLTSMN